MDEADTVQASVREWLGCLSMTEIIRRTWETGTRLRDSVTLVCLIGQTASAICVKPAPETQTDQPAGDWSETSTVSRREK